MDNDPGKNKLKNPEVVLSGIGGEAKTLFQVIVLY